MRRLRSFVGKLMWKTRSISSENSSSQSKSTLLLLTTKKMSSPRFCKSKRKLPRRSSENWRKLKDFRRRSTHFKMSSSRWLDKLLRLYSIKFKGWGAGRTAQREHPRRECELRKLGWKLREDRCYSNSRAICRNRDRNSHSKVWQARPNGSWTNRAAQDQSPWNKGSGG